MSETEKDFITKRQSESIMAQTSRDSKFQGIRVRNLLMNEIEKYFTMDPHAMSDGEIAIKRDLLLRMAPNTIPRLTIIQGDEEGGPVKFQQITGMQIIPEVINANTIQDEKSETTSSS